MEYLLPIVKQLIAYVKTAPTSKTNNVYTKYCSQKQGELAMVCEKSKHILNDVMSQEWSPMVFVCSFSDS